MIEKPFLFGEINSELVPKAIEKILELIGNLEFSSFALGCQYPDNITIKEKEKLKEEFQSRLVKSFSEKIGKEIDYENPDIYISIYFPKHMISLRLKSVYIQGSYNKLVRNLSQTFPYCYSCRGRGCNDCKYSGRLDHKSIEELVSEIALPLFNSKEEKFHGSGREDLDVRMLGSGRKFILEIIDPEKRSINLKELEDEINKKHEGKIKISNLKFTTKKEVVEIKQAMSKKIYGAKILCENEVDLELLNAFINKEILVKQETPNRVSNRRAHKIREKNAEILKVEKVSDKMFFVEIKADAGLYIKEFISSDNSRTIPNISELVKTKCKCFELDVLKIIE